MSEMSTSGMYVLPMEREHRPAQYSWSNWHQNYLPSEAKKEADQRTDEAHTHATQWKGWGEKMDQDRELKEAQCKESVAKAENDVRQTEWEMDAMKAKHQERILTLQNLVEQERKKTESVQKACYEAVARERAECEQRVQQIEREAEEGVKRANAAAAESFHQADVETTKIKEQTQAARQECDEQVKQARDWADGRISQIESEKWAEVDKINAWIEERGQKMDQTLRSAEQQRCLRALDAAQRIDAAVAHNEDKRAAEQLATARMRVRFEDWRSSQHKSNAELLLQTQRKTQQAAEREAKSMQNVMGQAMDVIASK